MKEKERQDLAKMEVMETLNVPEGAVQIDRFEYALETAQGWVKVKATAVKAGSDFDAEFENSEFLRKERERAENAEKTRLEKEEKAAKRAAAKKAKEEETE